MPPACEYVGIVAALRVGGPELIAAIILVGMVGFVVGVLVMGERRS